MSDYTARDIHLLDQALVDALEDVDGWVTDMDVRADLNERGIAIAGANLTAQLAENHSHMGLAGFAALATIRRIQEREQTKAFRIEMEALRAETAELTAELEKVRGQLTAANHHADGLANNLHTAQRDLTAEPRCGHCGGTGLEPFADGTMRYADGLANDVASLTKAQTAYANGFGDHASN